MFFLYVWERLLLPSERLTTNLPLAQMMFQEQCTAELEICALHGVKPFAQFAPEVLHQELWDEALGLGHTVPTLKWLLEDQH